MAVTRTGSIIEIQSSANSGSQSITIPADAQLMLVGAIGATNDTTSDLLSGNPPTIAGNSMALARDDDDDDSGILTAIFRWVVSVTGPQTFAWNWGGTNAHVIGGIIKIAFYKGANTGSPIGATGGQQALIAASASAGTLTATSGDAIFAVAGAARTTTNPTGVSWTGPTELDDTLFNNCRGSTAEAFPSGNLATSVTQAGGSGDRYTTVSAVVIAQGGTLHTQDVSGAVTPTGVLVKSTAVPRAGTVTPIGAAINQVSKTIAGTITPAGAVAAVRTFLQSASGSITPTGAVTKQTAKVTAGSVWSSGGVIKSTAVSEAGSITPTGSLNAIKSFIMSLGGGITPSGATQTSISKLISGTVSSTGVVRNSVNKLLAGSITPSGAVTAVKTYLLSLSGAVTPSGGLTRYVSVTFSASASLAGGLIRSLSIALTGAVTPSGVVSTVSGAVSLVAAKAKGMWRGMFKGMS